MFIVYAIFNRSKNKYYIGQTKDLKLRLKLHNEKAFKGYTSQFKGEWKLIYKEYCKSRLEALKREKQLKSYRGRLYIKKFIPR